MDCCTYCAKAKGRCDNLGQRHTVATCPFLREHVCMRCYAKGHLAHACRSATKLLRLHLACSKLEDSATHKMAQMDYEVEHMRVTCMQQYLQERKRCSFCMHRWSDGFFRTHNVHTCPRLACMVCAHCRCTGHMERYCPKKTADGWNDASTTSDYVIAFDDDGNTMTCMVE